MAETKPQTFSNHTRWDPIYHFFVVPLFLLTVLMAVLHMVHFFMHHHDLEWGWISLVVWMLLLSLAAAIAILKLRFYALKVQDRVIRLEERLRLATVLPDPLRGRIGDLTEGQIIALRFASDAELPGLVHRALAEKLSRSDIKKAIRTWRPDYWRV